MLFILLSSIVIRGMLSLSRGRRPFSNFHRVLAIGGAMVLVLLSCGREPTTGPMRTPGGVARGLSFNAIFPPMPNIAAFASVVDFNRVRVLLHHVDGSVALDTMVAFPAGADAITLSFDVTLAPGTPAAGEVLALNLAYLNAAGDTVFRGGPVDVRAAAAVEGAPPPPPVSIPVVYSGPGATAKTLKISPRSLTVNAGAPFTFTTVAVDSTGATVANAPVVWVTPDPTLATIPVATVGSGTANAARGTARIIAQLINGASDTVSLNVIPVATAIAVASGNSQSGIIGKPTPQALAQPIVVKVTAGDGLGVAGVTVAFAAGNGGSVGAASVVTDAAGLAQTTWTLGTSATSQTATATVASLAGSPVTFSATGAPKPATKLVLTSGPAASADIPSGSPTPLVIAAQDVDGDPALSFTGNVTVALSANPAGGTLAGTLTVAAVGGVASFPAISIAKPGVGYVLQATSGTLTPVATNVFNIVTGPAANVTLVSGGGQTAEAGAPLLPIKVLVTDVNGNPKSGAPVAFAAGATFGTLAPASVVTASDGTASAVWTLGATVGAQTMTATTGSVTPLTVSASAVAVVRQWVVTQQPSASLVAGTPITPAIKAEVRDAFDKVVPSFTAPVTIAIGANPGSSALGGTLTVNAVAGVATFAGIDLNKSGAGYTLILSSPSTTSATTSAFTVTPATAASLAIVSGGGQSGTVGVALAAPVVSQVSDAFGNPVPGAAVTLAVATGGGSVAAATGTTDAAGRVSTTWTLGAASAAQTLTISSTGVASVTATATAASPARMLVVTQQPTNTQAGTPITPAFTVEMRDGFNTVVPTFTGAMTVAFGVNPASGTLSGPASVNAVAGVATFSGLSVNKAATGYTLVASAAGAADVASAAFNITPATATTLAIASGNAQTGTVGAALPAPIVVLLTDALGNGIPGANVSVAVTTGGGTLAPATGTTDASGRFSTTWTLGSASAAQSVTASRAGLPSATATATAVSPTRALVFTQEPTTTQAGTPVTPAVKLEVRDGFNALVPSFTGVVTLAIGTNPGGATLSGTASVNAVGGVATFGGLSLNKTGTGYTLVASASGIPDAASSAFNVTPASAATLAIASGNGQSGTVGTALTAPVVAMVDDAFGNPVPGVSVTFAATTGGGSVAPAAGTTDASGRISTTWTLGSASAAQALTISSTGLTSVNATATAASPVRQLAIVQQPSSAQAGATIAPAVSIQMRDGFNALVPSFTGPITVVIGSNPGSAALIGTATVNAVAGVATFSGLSIDKAATGYTLVASASGASDAASNTFNITSAAPTALAIISGNAQTGAAGSALAQPIVVKLTDSFGNPVAAATVSFTVASGGGSATPSSGTTDAAGQISTTWTLGSVSPSQTLTIGSAGVASVTATATGTSAVRALVFTQQPGTSQVAGVGIAPPMTVEMRDGFGAVVPSFTGAVTLAMGSNCCGATLGGTPSANAVAGVATFTGISLDKRGGGYTLVASASGATSATSTPFVVSPGAAKTVAVTSGAGQSGAAGSALSSPVVAFVTDAYGNGVAAVPVTVRVASGGGSVTPTSAATDSTGRLYATWTLGSGSTTQRLEFVVAGVDSAATTATASSGVTLTWTFTTQPASPQTAGTAINPAVVAELRDGAGVLVTSYSGNATMGRKTGPSGSVLGGTTSVTVSGGVATFSNLTLAQAGTYTLEIGASGTTDLNTNSFTVSPAAAAAISVASGGSQSGTFGAMLPAPVVLKVVDAYGNPVTGRAVTFAVASGGGSVGTPSATTDASGLASTTWTLGSSGAQSITGSSSGLTGSPITISATVAGGSVATTVVAPRNDTLTSLGATRALSATARDVGGSVVAGSFTWASRDGAVASVSSGGVVTAIANGSTYIVASEIGGTRDSALIVVQQRTATINVTPGSRSLYVTGTFAYSALAVDGRGNAMAVQPTITWSSTSPTVASVNATTGAVSALAIGTTQIRATAGSIIGVSPLSVLTPITRIVVSIDTGSVPATVPDTFTMTALGLRRAYRAVARDTLDNPMTGVTFSWASTNASVAAIDTPAPTTAGATSAANGITSIQASAQGVTGSATLFVAQVLASIELTPSTVTVFVGGNTPVVARGKDSNGRYISGGSFTYSSSGPAFASVNATTGIVTGVAFGSANISAASGAITSNNSLITVTNEGGPSVISFGRDTIGVGRGTSVSVPILLSKPYASPLTVTLSAVDTNAYWAASSIVIPAGATAGNATLYGRNAGTTRVSATDASAAYTGATAVVAVQANMRLTTTYYSLNQTDQTATQVVLSDPSPAGGTYVTFSYGTPGVAQVSPDPAFIPPGQLAADIVIRGIGAGTTTVTPLATGVSGTGATVAVSAAVLNIPSTSVRLGAGQFEPNVYVQVPNYLSNPLTIALASSDTSVATTAPSIVIPASSYYKYFEVDGRAPGTASIIASATGWMPDTLYVTTTTPKVSVCCGYTVNSTSPAQNLSINTTDSTGYAHSRISSLSVRLTSSDTTVIKVIDSLTTVAAGTYYAGTARVIPNGTGGTAWIYVTAGGHMSDSVKFTVIGPSLSFGGSSSEVGLGQVESNQYVTIPNAISKPLVVTLTNSDSTFGATDPTVTIPAGYSYAYLPVRGRGIGTSTIIASAPGYVPDTLSARVTAPVIRMYSGATINSYSSYSTNVYTTDADGSYHNRLTDLTVSIRSSDPSILSIDSTAVIPAGYYYVPSSIAIQGLSPGTVKVYVTAPGHGTDSTTWTVSPARVALSWENYEIGARQRQPASFYVYIPNARSTSVPVTLSHSNPAAVSLSTLSPTIPPGTNYVYFDMAGLATGIDTVIATASGYLPDTAYFRVSSPRLLFGSFPTTGTTTNPPASVLLYVADSSGSVHYASDSLTLRAVSSDSNVIKPVARYFRVAKDSYYTYTGYQFVGPGTATITYSDSAATGYLPITSNTVTVTGPSLSVYGSPGTLGTGQHTFPTSYYVSLPNPVGVPLKVAMLSTDPRVATVPDTVIVPAGQTYAYFTITAQDTIGTVQIQATATGYTASSTNMQVTQSKLVFNTPTSVVTTTPPNYIVVYAEDANNNVHLLNADLTVTLLSSAPGVASIDSTAVTITKDAYYSNVARWTPGSVGSAQLTASDTRAIRYPFVQGSATVSVGTPAAYLGLSTGSLGIGQFIQTYTSIQNALTTAVDVPLGHAATPTTSTPASVTIPASSSYTYFNITGTSVGTDTITAAPAGHTPAIAVITVDKGRIDASTGWLSGLKAGDSSFVTLYTRAPDATTVRNVANATTFTLTGDANVTFTLGGASGAPITSVTVPASGYYVQFYVKAVSGGTANVSISNANYVTYTNSVVVTP